MKDKKKLERYEYMYGPHFNEEYAIMVVSKMKNENGTVGAHWTLEQTTQVAQQYGINLNNHLYNKYDWFVTMNMFYSDYYKAVISMTNSDNVKYYVDLSKAWLEDKDASEGKMWYYFKYVICDQFRTNTEDDEEEDEYDEEYDYYPREYSRMRRSYKRSMDEDDDIRPVRSYPHYRGRFMSRY